MEERKITMHGKPLTLTGKPVKFGDEAPDFSASGEHLQTISLKDTEFHNKILVISVFPSIDTSVCSAQMHHFNKIATESNEDVIVIAISCDLPFALHRFCAAEGIDRVITLSDYKDTNFGIKYGFLIKELRLLSRGIVIIDKEQKIKYAEYVSEITKEPDYDKALEILHQL